MTIRFIVFYIGFLLIFFSHKTYSQIIIKTPVLDTVSNWKNKNLVGLDLSQIAFSNWNAGGNSSISGLLKGNFSIKYEVDNTTWNNEMNVNYGINKQDGRELRKTDDLLRIESTVGFRKDTLSRWYHSAKFNFNTQFTNGYDYSKDRNLAISKFFAPAYLILGIGTEYMDKKNNLNFYFSPLTQRTTLVLDEELANQGAFGVKKAIYDENNKEKVLIKGEKSITQIGIYVTNRWKTEISKDIIYENKLELFTNYLKDFGNIVISWDAQINLIVNQYVKANIGLSIMYDDNIRFETNKIDENGNKIKVPKVQLKQMLGVGLVYAF